MQISPQTQQFLTRTVDRDKNGVTYQELASLDCNQDGKLDATVRPGIAAQDIDTIEAALKQVRSGQHAPAEIVFPTPASAQDVSPRQIGSVTVPSLPWPPPTGMRIPGPMVQENFGPGIDTPEKAIQKGLIEISQVMSVPLGDIRYNPKLGDAAKFNQKTGEIEIGNDAFRTLGSLKATLVHELVHRRHFMNERLFKQPLGKSEVEAYNFVIDHRERLGLSDYEVQLQKTLRDKVSHEWKQGIEPGYRQPVKKPPNYTEILKRWGI